MTDVPKSSEIDEPKSPETAEPKCPKNDECNCTARQRRSYFHDEGCHLYRDPCEGCERLKAEVSARKKAERERDGLQARITKADVSDKEIINEAMSRQSKSTLYDSFAFTQGGLWVRDKILKALSGGV